MSTEDNLFGIEDLDDTRAPTSSSAEQLQATPMSAPPKGRGQRKAKYKLVEVPREVYQFISVYDRNGREQKDIVEFDPETGNGKRLRRGKIEDCYLYNGYIVADGIAHPDEDQLPQIIDYVEEEVKLRGKSHVPHPEPEFINLNKVIDGSSNNNNNNVVVKSVDSLKTNPVDSTPESLRCPKCQSRIRFDHDQKAIVCTNGSCGMTWHSNGGVGKG
jgi:hypothetical protein